MNQPGEMKFCDLQGGLILIRAVGGKQGGLSRKWAANKEDYGPWLQVAAGPAWPRSPATHFGGGRGPATSLLLGAFPSATKAAVLSNARPPRKLNCTMNYSYTCSIHKAEPFGWAPKCLLAFCDSAVAKLMSAVPRGKSSIFLFT